MTVHEAGDDLVLVTCDLPGCGFSKALAQGGASPAAFVVHVIERSEELLREHHASDHGVGLIEPVELWTLAVESPIAGSIVLHDLTREQVLVEAAGALEHGLRYSIRSRNDGEPFVPTPEERSAHGL